MERNVKDSQELSIVAMLTKGTPKSTKVEFVFLNADDSKELKKVGGDLQGDPQYSTAKTATCKFKPDPVPDDKDHYGLKYKVVCDKEEFAQAEIIKVWPAKGKLEAKNADDQKVLANFQFKVVQAGHDDQPTFITDAKGVAEFRLEAGAPFTIEPLVPFEVKKKETPKLRELKVEAVRKFTPCFVEPARPNDGQIKQFVNMLTAAKEGRDGLGSKVKIKIGVKEDIENPGKPAIGGKGVFAYVKVKFDASGGNAKSGRNKPKTELLATGVTDLVAVTANVEYTGKVELKDGGKGEFEIELGNAGGDRCEVSLGSVKDTWDANTLTFTNWRKMHYELMAPKSIGDQLVEKTLPDGRTKVKDFPRGARDALVASSPTTFVEYECVGSKIYDVDENLRKNCMVMKREFFERTTGPAEVAVLTDHTFKLSPGGVFAKPKKPIAGFKLCDFNLFAESDADEPAISQDGTGSTQLVTIDLPADVYWLPKSSLDGSDTIRSIKWTAVTAGLPATHPAFMPDGTPKSGDLSLADVDMTRSTYKKVVVKLPAGSEPANLAGAGATKCPITVVAVLKGHHAGLGLAGQGAQKGNLLCVFSTANPISSTHITLHELGHQYALTPYGGADDSYAPGIKKRSSITENEAINAYKSNGVKGHLYDGHHHSGTHCAYGLSDAQKGRANFNTQVMGAAARCIMFGGSTVNDTGYNRDFCPQCAELIRARDLSTLV